MAWMIRDAKFLLEDAAQAGRGANPGAQATNHRAAVHDVMELWPLGCGECARAATAIACLDAFHALPIAAANQDLHAAAVDLQQLRNLRWRAARHTEQERLQTQRDPGRFVARRRLAHFQQLAAST